MRIIKAADYADLSRKAANLVAAQIISKPESVLGLATGSSPEGLYNRLVQLYDAGDLDFSKVKTVNLDEYKGLSRTNSQSYAHFMASHLFDRINIKKENTHLPNGELSDSAEACAEYEALVQSLGSADLQLLGIGSNGHIGFNEPSDSFSSVTHCVALADSTIKANSRFFDSIADVPKHAYTMGIGTIMRAQKILLVASGKAKAKILKEMLSGPVTPKIPASILQFHHDVTIVADEDALSEITL